MTGGALVSAAEALKAARAAGIRFAIDGEELVLDAPVQPAAAILDLVSRHTDGIMALLRPGGDGWSAEDWQTFFNERAGIAESDGHPPRPEAEARALAASIAKWLDRNFVRSPPGRCLACGCSERALDPTVPFGTESIGHAWLHPRCWPAWHAGRRAAAAASLAGMGIERPASAE
jgi:hypothetical protein